MSQEVSKAQLLGLITAQATNDVLSANGLADPLVFIEKNANYTEDEINTYENVKAITIAGLEKTASASQGPTHEQIVEAVINQAENDVLAPAGYVQPMQYVKTASLEGHYANLYNAAADNAVKAANSAIQKTASENDPLQKAASAFAEAIAVPEYQRNLQQEAARFETVKSQNRGNSVN